MSVELERMDWENVKKTSEDEIRRLMIGMEVNRLVLDLANQKLEAFSSDVQQKT